MNRPFPAESQLHGSIRSPQHSSVVNTCECVRVPAVGYLFFYKPSAVDSTL